MSRVSNSSNSHNKKPLSLEEEREKRYVQIAMAIAFFAAGIVFVLIGSFMLGGVGFYGHAGVQTGIGTTAPQIYIVFGGAMVAASVLGLYLTYRADVKQTKEREKKEIDLVRLYDSKRSGAYVPRGNPRTGTIIGVLQSATPGGRPQAVYSTTEMDTYVAIPSEGVVTPHGERINVFGEWDEGLDGQPLSIVKQIQKYYPQRQL